MGKRVIQVELAVDRFLGEVLPDLRIFAEKRAEVPFAFERLHRVALNQDVSLLPAEPVPHGLDWDLWVGPGPMRPCHPKIIQTSGTHSAFMDYSGGWTPCWAPHIIDLPVWALDLGLPTMVSSSGGRYVFSHKPNPAWVAGDGWQPDLEGLPEVWRRQLSRLIPALGPPADDIEGATERLDMARRLLREHGNYDWLTESGNFVISNNGMEWAVTYFVMILALFFSGAGKASLDHLIAARLRKSRL